MLSWILIDICFLQDGGVGQLEKLKVEILTTSFSEKGMILVAEV